MVARTLVFLCVAVLGGFMFAPGASAAGLSVRASDVRVSEVGSYASVRVTVRNTTRRTIRSVTLRVRPGKRVAASRTRLKVASMLRPRRSKRVTVKVRATAPLNGAVRVGLRATGRGKRSGTGAFRVRPKAAPQPGASPAGRYFYRQYFANGTTWYDGLYFVDDQFVYHGTPETRPTCTTVTVTEPEGDGCLTYSFDPATSAITIEDPFADSGRWSGRLNGSTLTLTWSIGGSVKTDTFTEGIPPPG